MTVVDEPSKGKRQGNLLCMFRERELRLLANPNLERGAKAQVRRTLAFSPYSIRPQFAN